MSLTQRTVMLAVLTMGTAVLQDAAASERFEACRYEGGRFEGSIHGLTESADRAGAIARILRYTGLPANFQVMQSAEVPNAAAVILQGEDGLLKRVIVYNESFMLEVSSATHTAWAGISILAHEIGHHLCGHTLLPGGSQPPSELEADSFSGFVLAKMGATLEEAQTAMRTLGSDSGSATHPPKRSRLEAIAAGFEQAREIEATAAAPGPRTSENGGGSQRRPEVVERERSRPETSAPERSEEPPAAAASDASDRFDLDPILSASIPLKLDRFVYDEVGALSAPAEKALNDRLAEHAARHNVEIIVVMVRSLRGKTARGLATQLMRQLSVGQADLSNGGVILVCPPEDTGAFAFMPGLVWSLGPFNQLVDILMEQQIVAARPALGGRLQEIQLEALVDPVLGSTSNHDWSIRYTTLGDVTAAGRSATGKLARIFGVVTSTTGAPHKESTPASVVEEYREVEILADGGRHLTVRVLPETEFEAASGEEIVIFGRLASVSSPTIQLNSYTTLADR